MLQFRGAPALSSFRVERLLASLKRIDARVRTLEVEFVHYVDTARPLQPAELAVLERLLEARGGAAAATLYTVPRFGTVSPWSSKATDIAHVCGLTAVRRIERGKAWRIDADSALADDELAALAAALFDPMTEAPMGTAVEAERLFAGPGRPHEPWAVRELVGLPEGSEIVAYCHSGSRSALAALALRAAGYDARNYPGSWHEWSRHPDLPAER